MVVNKGDQIPALRESNVADPSISFVQHLADREFDTVTPSGSSHDGEPVSVRRPIGICNVFRDLARRAAGKRRPSQGSDKLAMGDEVPFQQYSHFAQSRDCQYVNFPTPERTRFRGLRTVGEHSAGVAVPGRCIQHRSSIRGKSC